jgi:hypothetical protein
MIHKEGTLLLLILLLTVGSARGQKVVVSNPLDISSQTHYEIIGQFNEQLLLYFEERGRIDIHAFDTEMKKQWTKELHMVDKSALTIGLVPGEQEFHHFYSYREADTTVLVHDIYNLRAELQESYFVLKSARLGSRFKFSTSTDGLNALFFQSTANDHLWTLSYDFNEAFVSWEREFELEAQFERSFVGVQLTQKNELYLVLSVDNKKSRREEHQFVIYYARPDNSEVKAYQVPTSDVLMNSGQVLYDELHERLNVVGFYSRRNLDQSEGLFYFTLSPEDTNVEITSYPWNKELEQKMLGASNSGGQGITGLELKQAILREDGGVLLMGEVEKIYQRRASFAERNMYSRGGSWVDFVYEDILLVSIHPEGDFHWNKIINKRQFSQDDNGLFSSFFVFSTPSMIRIMFNDEIKVNNTASSYEIFGDGKVNRTSILSTQYQQLQLRFLEAYQYSATEMVVPSEYKGSLKLVQIQF